MTINLTLALKKTAKFFFFGKLASLRLKN